MNKERERTKLSGMRRGRRNVSSSSRESAGKYGLRALGEDGPRCLHCPRYWKELGR